MRNYGFTFNYNDYMYIIEPDEHVLSNTIVLYYINSNSGLRKPIGFFHSTAPIAGIIEYAINRNIRTNWILYNYLYENNCDSMLRYFIAQVK